MEITVINRTNRTMTDLSVELSVTGSFNIIEKPGKIMPAENKAEGIPYSIKYSDLDINGHFNSVKYIEHLLDLFDIDQFKTREIGRLEIAYQSEGKQGMPLTLHKAESAPDKQDMAICHEGKAICRAAVTWR